jgi:PAS domain S-box-containing protein
MISNEWSLSLWIALIGLDLAISTVLARKYRRDFDIRKLMFIIGLLMCINVYAIAILGIESFPQAENILGWSPLPLLLAFIFTSLHERFGLDSKTCYKFFILGTVLTIILFFIPMQTNFSQPFLLAGLTLAVSLCIIEYSKRFDLSSLTLFLSMPSFAVSYIAIEQGLTELALFAAFTAKGALLIAFEISKNQDGETSSILVLKKELRTAEYNFNRLLDVIPDPAAIIDAKGTILAVSPKIVAMTGFKKKEIMGMNFLKADLISEGSKFTMMQNLGIIMLGFETPPYEINVQDKDGKKWKYEVNASKTNYKGKPATMVVFRDLTERNKLLGEIQREKMRFQSIAEGTGDWIWELDCEGNFTYSNPVVEKIIGFTADEMTGKRVFDVFVPNMDDNTKPFLESTLSESCLSPIITNCYHRDHHLLTMETHVMPMHSLDVKHIVGYRGVSRDFSEKKELEKKLLKAERFSAIGELSTIVAHDLRNPLQGISNVIHYLKKSPKELMNKRVVSVIPSIEEALKHADSIIRELLDYSADMRLELRQSTPKAIVMQAVSGIVVPDNIRLIEKTETRPKIYVDPEKIRRVIVNLVTNAFDAMPDGGILTIESRETNGCFELSIADNGTGIPDEKISRLWAPFVTTKAKGIGLGLPICKRIMDEHGGQILCDTEKGKGTTFTLILPIIEPKNKDVEFYVDGKETITRSTESSYEN